MLFDLDGTLVDHDTALRQGLTAWLTEKRLATEDQCASGLVDLWDDVAERHFPAWRAREVTFAEQRRLRLREFLPHVGVATERMDDRALDLVFADYLGHYEAAWRAYDDVLPCLTALSGLRLAVLSNGDQAQQEDKLRRTGLLGHVEAVLTSDGLGVAKPQAAAFRLACERLDVEPSRVAYVGDRLDVDARPATAAGLCGVWLDRTDRGEGPYAPTIASLAELPGLLAAGG